jgi:hypothetical protein
MRRSLSGCGRGRRQRKLGSRQRGTLGNAAFQSIDLPAKYGSVPNCNTVRHSQAPDPHTTLRRTFNLVRALGAHVLIVQIPHLLLLRRGQRRRVRGPCVLADDVAVCVAWPGCRRHRGAWCAVHRLRLVDGRGLACEALETCGGILRVRSWNARCRRKLAALRLATGSGLWESCLSSREQEMGW